MSEERPFRKGGGGTTCARRRNAMSEVQSLVTAKEGFRRLFLPDHPARLALEAQPDGVTEAEFTVLYPLLIRLAGTKTVNP